MAYGDYMDDDEFEYQEEENGARDWLDEEDICGDFMLGRIYLDDSRATARDHGFGGRDDDGFRGLDEGMDTEDWMELDDWEHDFGDDR